MKLPFGTAEERPRSIQDLAAQAHVAFDSRISITAYQNSAASLLKVRLAVSQARSDCKLSAPTASKGLRARRVHRIVFRSWRVTEEGTPSQLETAFVLLVRAAKISIEDLPSRHPQYNTLDSAKRKRLQNVRSRSDWLVVFFLPPTPDRRRDACPAFVRQAPTVRSLRGMARLKSKGCSRSKVTENLTGIAHQAGKAEATKQRERQGRWWRRGELGSTGRCRYRTSSIAFAEHPLRTCPGRRYFVPRPYLAFSLQSTRSGTEYLFGDDGQN